MASLIPRPHPLRGKGSIECFLGCSAFLFLRKPIRLQLYDFHVMLHPVAKQRCTRSAVLV